MRKDVSFRDAVYWAYVMNWGEKGFGAFFTFLLASLVGPREFGTIALAMIYIAFIQLVLDQGLFAALIQRKDLRPAHLDAVFWFNLGVGVLLMAVSAAVSGWWAKLNDLPELTPVISALSVTILIEALAKVQRAVLQRNLEFKTLSIRANVSVIVGGVVGTVMAFKGYGVWALVGQRVCQEASAVCLLWTLGQWRPGLRFSPYYLKDLFGFSVGSFISKFGDFAYRHADAAFMGVFFGPVAVGLFRLAQRLVSLTLDLSTNALQVVSFSEFSRRQNDEVELKRSALKCVRLSSLTTLPLLAGLAASSVPLMALLGAKWASAAPALAILCLFGVFQVLAKFSGPLLSAKARPHLLAALTWSINAISIASLLLAAIALRNGTVERQIVGIALTRVAVGLAIATPIYLSILLRITRISMTIYVSTIGPSITAACGTFVTVLSVNRLAVLTGFGPTAALGAGVFLGGLTAVGLLLALDKEVLSRVRDLVPRQIGGRAKAPTALRDCEAMAHVVQNEAVVK